MFLFFKKLFFYQKNHSLSPGAWYKVPQNQIGMVWHPELVFQNMEKLVTVSIYGSDEKYKIWYGDNQKEVQFYQTIQVILTKNVAKFL